MSGLVLLAPRLLLLGLPGGVRLLEEGEDRIRTEGVLRQGGVQALGAAHELL